MTTTNIKKLKAFIKEQKEEEVAQEERKNKSAIDFYQNKVDKNCLFLCPPHENMDGMPFVPRGKHRNCGPEGKTDFMCVSLDGKKLDQCVQCREVRELYNSTEADKKKAGKMKRNQRFYWQVIDCTPLLYVEKGEKPNIPDCLLDHPAENDAKTYNKRGCKACDWEDSCKAGIMAWSIGKKIQKPLLGDLDDYIEDEDVTNPKEFRPLQVVRTGKQATDTEYSGVKFLKKCRFPDEVITRIYENLIDLSQVSLPKDEEKIKTLMTGIATEDAEGEEESQTPKCFGEYDDDDKECLKCDYCDPCEVEGQGGKKNIKPSDDDDEEEGKVTEVIDPELEGEDDPEDDELEKQLRLRAQKKANERKAQRTPVSKKDEDD